jgi:hypothetical protein
MQTRKRTDGIRIDRYFRKIILTTFLATILPASDMPQVTMRRLVLSPNVLAQTTLFILEAGGPNTGTANK